MPYVLTQNVSRAPRPPATRATRRSRVGGDLKYRLASNLLLNATVNPDFGQVEADPSVLNLGAFETFFEERRPFFVEGKGLFTFTVNCVVVVDCNTGEGLFYSRRIGRSPQLSDDVRRRVVAHGDPDHRRRQDHRPLAAAGSRSACWTP